jgi:integrase
MNVILRQRQKSGKVSLYLEYYERGKRQYEYLNLYLTPDPEKGRLTREQKDSNRTTLALAEAIRSKRYLELQNGVYGFLDKSKRKASFLNYVELLIEKKNTSKGNYDNWDSMLKHLKKYGQPDVAFDQITGEWLEGFQQFLNETKSSNSKPLSQNSKVSYYSKLVSAVKQAVKDGYLQQNPAHNVKGFAHEETEREFLTHEELQALANTDCSYELLKRAFLFSALTGLRWSDIIKLRWIDVQHAKELGYFIRFRQKKTKGAETLPISTQAYQLMGVKKEDDSMVFDGLKYSAWNNLKLSQWALRAGITKHITFHSARHSFATLQLTLGTDIYTVSKMLGHKHLKTTQVYSRVIDQKKQDAANKIKITL